MWLMRVLRSARPRFFLSHLSSPLQLCVVTSRAAPWLGHRGGIREKRSAGENESPHRTGSCARLKLLLMQQLQQLYRLHRARLSLSMHSADLLDIFEELILGVDYHQLHQKNERNGKRMCFGSQLMHEWEFVAVMILGNVLDWISLAVSPQAMLLLIILGIPVEVCKMRI